MKFDWGEGSIREAIRSNVFLKRRSRFQLLRSNKGVLILLLMSEAIQQLQAKLEKGFVSISERITRHFASAKWGVNSERPERNY